MKRIRILAAALMLAGPSYASAQSGEGLLGQPVPEVASDPSIPRRTSGLNAAGETGAALARGLAKVEAEGRSATRGAAETRIYQRASPAVVLVLAEKGFGSGALISADGQIITNFHVVGNASTVGVVFKPAKEGAEITEANLVRARVVKRDELADLALLKVEALPPGVVPLKLGTLDTVQVGADVNAIGHPTGESWTYTRGIVSQIRQGYVWHYDNKTEHTAAVIQTQTPINPGNSGGPLLDDSLKIVGLNSFGAEGEGLNFAVSADDIHAFLARPGDRMAQKSTSATPARKTGKTCELVELGATRDKRAGGIYRDIDIDCDDKADFIMFEPDDEKDAYAYLFDEDDNGHVDTVIYDADHDGEFDFALYDTDEDGKPDVRGDFRKGEDEPYRYERLSKR